MKRLYLVLRECDSLLCRIIKWYQYGDNRVHIGIVYDMSDIRHPLVFEADNGKIGINKYDCNEMRFSYYYVYVDDRVFERDIFNRLVKRYLNKGYDYRGLLSFILRYDLGNSSKYFCSELVYEFLLYCGVGLFKNTKPYEVYPSLFLKSDKFREDIYLNNIIKKGRG